MEREKRSEEKGQRPSSFAKNHEFLKAKLIIVIHKVTVDCV